MNLDLARWQFAIVTVYHFLFVPLTIGLSLLVAGMQTAWVRTEDERYLRMTKFWGEAVPDQLRHGRGDGHRAGVPVRDELERLQPLRRRHLRCAAGDRGPARLLHGVDLPRAVDLRLGQAPEAASSGLHLARGDRHRALGLLHPRRELVDAASRRVRPRPRHRTGPAHRLRRGPHQLHRRRRVHAHHHGLLRHGRHVRPGHQCLAPVPRQPRRGVPALDPPRPLHGADRQHRG